MAISAQELNIILSARDKEFARAMAANQRRVERFAKQSQKQLSQTSKSFDVLGAAAKRLLPAIAAGAVVAAVKDVTAAMDEIGKKADAIGIGTDALQELRAAAVSAGVSQGGLDRALEQLSKRLGEAEQGTGTAVKALESMGLTAQELTGIPLDDALGVIADRFAKLEDATDKTAAATQLFGREGVAMVNVLKGGASELEKSRQRFRDLGVVIDEELIRSAEEMQDRFDAATTVIGAQFSTVLGRLAPLLVKAAENAASLAIAIADIVDAVERFVTGADHVDLAIRENIKSMAAEMRQSQALEQQLARGGTMSVEMAGKKLDEAKTRLENARAALEENRAMRLQSSQYKTLTDNIDIARAALGQITVGYGDARRAAAGISADQVAEQEQLIVDLIKERDALLSEAAPQELTDQLERATANVERLQEALKKARDGVIDLGEPIKPVALPDREPKKTAEKPKAKPDGIPATREQIRGLTDDTRELERVLESASLRMVDSFFSIASGAQTAEEAFKSLAMTALQSLTQIALQDIMRTGGGGGGLFGQLGSFLAGAFPATFGGTASNFGGATALAAGVPAAQSLGIGGFAQGGTLSAGQPAMVGESGRELFVPAVAGRILSVPQTKEALAGGGGVTVQQTINVTTGVQQTVRAEIQTLMPQIAAASTQAVLDARKRGGAFAGAFR
jgi:hypothetical protein